MRKTLLCISSILLALYGCKEDFANNTYCNLPARFTMQNTYQAPVLYTACNNMGEFCTITTSMDGKQFVFQGSSPEPSYVNINADAVYSGYYLGLSGLIVGLPNIPEMGMDASRIVCYDLACSNCYEGSYITKRMRVKDGYATCPSCSRSYNLNDRGSTATGRPLYRYRASYINNTLVISNR